MGRDLTEKDQELITNFGALGYPNERMASLLMWETQEVEEAMKEGLFKKLYEKGMATCEYVIDLKLFEMAKSGDLKALQKFEFRKNTLKNKQETTKK